MGSRPGSFPQRAFVLTGEERRTGAPVARRVPLGLVAAIQTGSVERGLEVADQLHTGIVHVNDQTLNNDAFAPFGGTGASGNGSRFGSQSSLDEFTQWQWVTSGPRGNRAVSCSRTRPGPAARRGTPG